MLIKAACLSLLQAPALRGPPVLLIHIICSNITGASQAPLCCVPSECINDAACTMFLCHPRTKGAATAAELQSQRPGMLDHVQQEQTPPSRRAAGRRVRLTPCALSISPLCAQPGLLPLLKGLPHLLIINVPVIISVQCWHGPVVSAMMCHYHESQYVLAASAMTILICCQLQAILLYRVHSEPLEIGVGPPRRALKP